MQFPSAESDLLIAAPSLSRAPCTRRAVGGYARRSRVMHAPRFRGVGCGLGRGAGGARGAPRRRYSGRARTPRGRRARCARPCPSPASCARGEHGRRRGSSGRGGQRGMHVDQRQRGTCPFRGGGGQRKGQGQKGRRAFMVSVLVRVCVRMTVKMVCAREDVAFICVDATCPPPTCVPRGQVGGVSLSPATCDAWATCDALATCKTRLPDPSQKSERGRGAGTRVSNPRH